MTTVKTNNVEGTQNDLTLKSNESSSSSNIVLQGGTSGKVQFKQKDSATTFTLPTEDGSSGSKIITDGNGVLAFEGAGGADPVPTTEKLIKTWDWNNHQLSSLIPSTTGLECMIPTSQADDPSKIEEVIWKFHNVNFGSTDNASNVNGDFMTWIAPISEAEGSPILNSTNAQWYSNWSEWNMSTGNWNNRSSNYSRKDTTHSVSGGSYACNDYGLNITGHGGYGVINCSNNSSTYHGPSIDTNPFTDNTTNGGTHNRTNFCGELKIYNTKSCPDIHYRYTWNESNGANQQKFVSVEGIGWNYVNNNNQIYNVTTGHAQGFRFYFLPRTYNNRLTKGIVSGRVEVFARLKQESQVLSLS